MAADTDPEGQEGKVTAEQLDLAVRQFETIIVRQLDIKNKLGDRLKNSIQTGMVILAITAVSVLVLLYTLTTQVNLIVGVVSDIDRHFARVSEHMQGIDDTVVAIEVQVAVVPEIAAETRGMTADMRVVDATMNEMRDSIAAIGGSLRSVDGHLSNIAVSMERMDTQIVGMTHDMTRISKPARNMNRVFPFP